VQWLCENILDYNQSMYDLSLLYSPNLPAATALCTDNALTVIPVSLSSEETKIAKRFNCRDSNSLPIEFRGLEILRDGGNLVLSQTGYSEKIEISDGLSEATKPELARPMNEDEISKLLSDAGKFAWIAVGTSPLSAFQASVALQRNKHQRIPSLFVVRDTRCVLRMAKDDALAMITYVPLDYETIHIRVYSDGAFQTLSTKHSQIGFLVFLADKDDTCNIIHWHSARAPRRPCSTEKSELMALDVALRVTENLRKIVFQLLEKETSLVLYVDCETLWSNFTAAASSSPTARHPPFASYPERSTRPAR